MSSNQHPASGHQGGPGQHPSGTAQHPSTAAQQQHHPISGSTSAHKPFQINQRVVVNKRLGNCKFCGEVPFGAGIWVGIELDEAVGRNDGSVQGKRYFECKAKHGVFVKAEQVQSAPQQKKPESQNQQGQQQQQTQQAQAKPPQPRSAGPGSNERSQAAANPQSQQVQQTSDSKQSSNAESNIPSVASGLTAGSAGGLADKPQQLPVSAQQSIASDNSQAGVGATATSVAGSSVAGAGSDLEKMKKKYEDLKKIAYQYKNQNEELKTACKKLKGQVEEAKNQQQGSANAQTTTQTAKSDDSLDRGDQSSQTQQQTNKNIIDTSKITDSQAALYTFNASACTIQVTNGTDEHKFLMEQLREEAELAKLERDLAKSESEELKWRLERAGDTMGYEQALRQCKDEILNREQKIKQLQGKLQQVEEASKDKSIEENLKQKIISFEDQIKGYEELRRNDDDYVKQLEVMIASQEREMVMIREDYDSYEEGLKNINSELEQAHKIVQQYKDRIRFLEDKLKSSVHQIKRTVKTSKKTKGQGQGGKNQQGGGKTGAKSESSPKTMDVEGKNPMGVYDPHSQHLNSDHDDDEEEEEVIVKPQKPLGSLLLETHGMVFRKQLALMCECFPQEMQKKLPKDIFVFILIQELARVIGVWIYNLPQNFSCVALWRIQTQLQQIYVFISVIFDKLELLSCAKPDTFYDEIYAEGGQSRFESCASDLQSMELFCEDLIIGLDDEEPSISDSVLLEISGVASKFTSLANFLIKRTDGLKITRKIEIERETKLNASFFPKALLDSQLYQLHAFCQIGLIRDPEFAAAFQVGEGLWKDLLDGTKSLIEKPYVVATREKVLRYFLTFEKSLMRAESRILSTKKQEGERLTEALIESENCLLLIDELVSSDPNDFNKRMLKEKQDKKLEKKDKESGTVSVQKKRNSKSDDDDTTDNAADIVQQLEKDELDNESNSNSDSDAESQSDSDGEKLLAQINDPKALPSEAFRRAEQIWDWQLSKWKTLSLQAVRQELQDMASLKPVSEQQQIMIKKLESEKSQLKQDAELLRSYSDGLERKLISSQVSNESGNKYRLECQQLRQQSIQHEKEIAHLERRVALERGQERELYKKLSSLSFMYEELRSTVEEREKKEGFLNESGSTCACEIAALQRLNSKYKAEIYRLKTGVFDPRSFSISDTTNESIRKKGHQERFQKKLQELQRGLIFQRASTKIVDLSSKATFLKDHPSSTLEHRRTGQIRSQAHDLFMEIERSFVQFKEQQQQKNNEFQQYQSPNQGHAGSGGGGGGGENINSNRQSQQAQAATSNNQSNSNNQQNLMFNLPPFQILSVTTNQGLNSNPAYNSSLGLLNQLELQFDPNLVEGVHINAIQGSGGPGGGGGPGQGHPGNTTNASASSSNDRHYTATPALTLTVDRPIFRHEGVPEISANYQRTSIALGPTELQQLKSLLL